MSAALPAPRPLIGERVELHPLTPEHLPELIDALARPEVFAAGYGGGPASPGADPASFVEFMRGYLPWGERPYLVRERVDSRPGAAIGTTSLYHVDEAGESLAIGYTAYDPRRWASGVNAECKLLLLREAFGAGFGRVEFFADAANARSRAAIARLGAQPEGIRRRDRQRADGTWRDAASYSILAAEFGLVEAVLRSRLAR